MLDKTASALCRIAYREDLTSEQSQWLLSTICAEDVVSSTEQSDGFYLLALTFGMMAKGVTADELYGFVLSLAEQSISLRCGAWASPMIDVSGTGGDKIKTFNVGSAASVVLAAGGAYVAKQATRAYTGPVGSADVFGEIGIDVFAARPEKIVACLETVGIAAFHTASLSPKLVNRLNFLKKLQRIGLSYPTLWHLVSWMYSPFPIEARLYGVFSERYVVPVAETFLRLGHPRAMVVYGQDGLDEISVIGETSVAEVRDGKTRHWTLTPESCGLRRARLEEIAIGCDGFESSGNPTARQQAFRHFFEVLYGTERGPKRDLVLVNAGAGFYLCGKARSIREGVEMAAAIIDGGDAAKKLREFAAAAGSPERLVAWENKLALPVKA
jgi:anthranilate phosphoribosyltransferase